MAVIGRFRKQKVPKTHEISKHFIALFGRNSGFYELLRHSLDCLDGK